MKHPGQRAGSTHPLPSSMNMELLAMDFAMLEALRRSSWISELVR